MFKFIKEYWLFFVVFFVFCFPACSMFFSTKESLENVLIVGTNSGFPPFEFINDVGEVVGFDVDVAQAIAQKMGKKLVVKDMAFDPLILSLQQGKIDLILAGMSITPSRLKEIEMVHYHGQGLTTLPLAFWKKIPAGVSTIYDLKKLKNKTVCAQAGNIQEELISKFDFLDIKSLSTYSELIMEIKYGKAIACVLEPFVVNEMKIQCPELQVLDVPLGPKDQNFGDGIGIKKENKKLIQQIKSVMAQLKQDGTLKSLQNKWFKEEGK